MNIQADLERIIGPIAESEGLELYGIEFIPQAHNALVRVYLDSAAGVGADDCQKVSYKINSVLGVELPTLENYVLEVSSPGLDRLLFTAEQVVRQLGKVITLQLHEDINERRRFKGTVLTADISADRLVIKDKDGTEFELPLSKIAKARVVPQW